MTLIRSAQARQRGVALVTSLLLLVIITILALSMFRSFGTQEKIAGNLEKMPPKSTYFYPKLLSALVFNSLKGN